jgi:hypothetical protein
MGRKPADPNIRITMTGSRPAPHHGPIARAQADEEQQRAAIAELARRFEAVRAQLDAAPKKKR